MSAQKKVTESTITLGQFLVFMAFIVTAIFGSAWALYTTGAFTPDTALVQEATSLRYELQQSQSDYRELKNSLNDSENKENLLKLTAEAERLRLQQEEVITYRTLVGNCITSSSSGQTAKWGGSSSMDVAATSAITNNPQDGTKLLKDCIAAYQPIVK